MACLVVLRQRLSGRSPRGRNECPSRLRWCPVPFLNRHHPQPQFRVARRASFCVAQRRSREPPRRAGLPSPGRPTGVPFSAAYISDCIYSPSWSRAEQGSSSLLHRRQNCIVSYHHGIHLRLPVPLLHNPLPASYLYCIVPYCIIFSLHNISTAHSLPCPVSTA